MSRSISERIVIYRKDPNFDMAGVEAYRKALEFFGADDSGNFGVKYRKEFPRSESQLLVQFKAFEITGGMGGQDFKYLYDCWIETTEGN